MATDSQLPSDPPVRSTECSAPSNWYKASEMEDLLKASPVPHISDNYDFCTWMSGHMNLALQKGYAMARGGEGWVVIGFTGKGRIKVQNTKLSRAGQTPTHPAESKPNET